MTPWTEQARIVLSPKVGVEASVVVVVVVVVIVEVVIVEVVVVEVVVDCSWVSFVPECQVILPPELPDQISWELHTARTALDPSWW